MEIEEADIVKEREITFAELHPAPNQAETASRMLSEVKGVLHVAASSPTLIKVRYDVLKVSLEQIESLLTETGFHLSSKLIYKLYRALYYYVEENQRANNGCTEEDHNSTRNIFINRYEHKSHGCQDPRPDHWRKYL